MLSTFDPIDAALASIGDFFQKHKKKSTLNLWLREYKNSV